MSRPLGFLAAAQAEFVAAAVWYEDRRTGLGEEFVGEVERVLAAIRSQPDRYPIVLSGVREAPVRRFPYAVYYRDSSTRIEIIAVFHCSRDPAVWQDRT
jgi:plasmid stabilization system protein ParE